MWTWLLAVVAQAAPSVPVAAAASLAAARTDVAPVIDGRLTDAVWAQAPASGAFTQKFPDEGQPPSEPTTVRVLYDDVALYIGIDCQQRLTPVLQRLTRRDRGLAEDKSKLSARPSVQDDEVAVSIDSRRDGTRSGFHFVVNVSGVLSDGLLYDDVSLDPSWDENWEAATARTDTGWSAELRIPLRVLRFESRADQQFGFNVRRSIAGRQEIDEWAFVPRNEAGFVSRFGLLTNLQGVRPPHAAFELRPFALAKIGRQDRALGPLRGSSGPATFARRWDAGGSDVVGIAGSVGADARWHVTRDVTLDGAFNPDFGQVEADQVVLNLSTIETFLPEKRPFFLEGLDTFATSAKLVYTRRIGRVPSSLPLGAGEKALEGAGPSAIPGALKLVGRLGDRTSFGAMSAVVSPNHVSILDAAGIERRRLVDPLTSFNVLRVRRSGAGNGHIGAMVTAVNRFEQRNSYPRTPNGEVACPGQTGARDQKGCFNDAYVAMIDGRWRSPGGDYAFLGQGGSSLLVGGPPRPQRDGHVITPGRPGWGTGGRFAKEGGQRWLWAASGAVTGNTLDYNDMGYQPRQNYAQAFLDVSYLTRKAWWLTQETASNLEIRHLRNLQGLVLANLYQVNTSWLFANHWRTFVEFRYRAPFFDDREVGDGTALQHAGLWGVEAKLRADPRRVLSGSVFLNAEKLSRGTRFELEGSLVLRPVPRVDVELIPELLYASGEPRYVSGGDTDRLLFGRLGATQLGGTLRATLTFTPRLTLQTYAQLFLARGHYRELTTFDRPIGTRPAVHLSELVPAAAGPADNPDFQRASINVSVVLRWEYRLGSVLYVVYTRSQIPQIELGRDEIPRLDFAALPRAPAADVFLVKLGWWWG